MRRWLVIVLLVGLMARPSSVQAQSSTALASVHVQLWPEYDQPSMLVIYEFQVAAGAQLPVGLTIKYPKDANLIAVAVQGPDGGLMNADYREANFDDAWQSVTVQIQSPSTYRIEYYQPLSRSGNRREFTFRWLSDYRVDALGVSVRLPTDAMDLSSIPELQPTQTGQGTPILGADFGAVAPGAAFDLELAYSRPSEALTASGGDLQPSEPLTGSTSGRVMLGNYIPYILGALGVMLVAGGGIYIWQSTRGRSAGDRRRHRNSRSAAGADSVIHCHQCGTRAQVGDRFCRVCGTKLRLPE